MNEEEKVEAPEFFIKNSFKARKVIITEGKKIYSDLIPIESTVIKDSRCLSHSKGQIYINPHYIEGIKNE